MTTFFEHYNVNPAVAMQEVQGRAMFLVPDDYDVLTLNASGTFVWQTLLAGTSAAQATEQLAARIKSL